MDRRRNEIVAEMLKEKPELDDATVMIKANQIILDEMIEEVKDLHINENIL